VILDTAILEERLDAKVLLTGASGFVGGRLRGALLDAGCDVVAIRRRSSPEPKAGRSVVADYTDVDGLAAVMAEEQPDFVFHVAGATKGVSYDDFQQANVMPTRNLLKALEKSHPSVKRFVLVSSLAAYGPSSPRRPHREEDNPNPIEHYGRSKLEAERLLAREADQVAWSIIRPSGVYGPGDGDYFNLFREVSKGRNVFVGNRERWFSAVYVDDCVRAIIACARSEAAIGKAYFICDGEPVTWGAFQRAIVEASGRSVVTLNLPEFLVSVAAFGGELATKVDKKPRLFNRQKAKMGAQDAWTCEHTAARDDFGYAPTVAVSEGVMRAFSWYRENGWL
jgi:nucleoside-diphosphate-sugar epimerase